jgi:hypothetical protein
MRNMGLALSVTFLICVAAVGLWGLGSDHGPGPVPAGDGGWPEAFTEIFNREDRVHGYFVNSGDVFFYAGDADAFNEFLEQCSKLEDADHELVLHPGKAKVRSPWDKEGRGIDGDWRLYADRRPRTPGKKYLVQVDLWLGGKVPLEGLKVPLNFSVRSGGEIEKFVADHKEKRGEAGNIKGVGDKEN